MSQPDAGATPSRVNATAGDLVRRLGVVAVGIPVVIICLWFGDAVLATLLGIFSALAAREFFQLAGGSARSMAVIGVPLAGLIPIVVHGHYLGVLQVPAYAVTLTVIAVMSASLWLRGVDGKPLEASSTTILGVLYTGGTLSYAYSLRYFGYAVGDLAGALVVGLPVLLTWSSDTGAYFAGRLVGGRKLMPSVSPAKTISGAIGGIVLTIIMCEVYVSLFLRPRAQLAFSPAGLILFAVTISIVSQLGDLVESLFKRSAGVKDSGSIFPGHGGVLDRLDSLFFVLPVSFALYKALLIPAP